MMESALLLPRIRTKFVWMFGRKIDLVFFFLPAFLAPALFILGQSSLAVKSALWAAVFVNAFGLGDFHIGATWFNYLDCKNWRFYTSSLAKIAIYFLAPVAIVAMSFLGMVFCPGLLAMVFIAWSVQHLVQQNVGLLLLYHSHGQNEAIVNRALETRSLHASALFFSLLFAQRLLFPPLSQSSIWQIIVAAIGLVLVALIISYLKELFLQVRQGKYLNAPAVLFWCLSIYFFMPFAFLGKTYTDAILIANIMHWAQYIGIMYVLVQRKYRNEQLANLPWNHPNFLFLLMGLGFVALLGVGQLLPTVMTDRTSWLGKSLLAFVLGMGMVHYLQDAFMWRFREPYYKETVLAYLRPRL